MKHLTKIKAGVIGWPISHSLGPHLHKFWLRLYNIQGEYIASAVKSHELENFFLKFRDDGWRGLNITIPHKIEAMRFVDEVHESAKKIGAINTVTVKDNGRLIGLNTDSHGFINNLIETCPGFSAEIGPSVVLGAGGAARAVIVSLLNNNVPEIRLLNRDLEKAKTLALGISKKIKVFDWSARSDVLSEAILLVNTTSLGMKGQPDLEINLVNIPKSAVVYDIVYNPVNTHLLKTARNQGNTTVDGLGMLLHQAKPGFAEWFGVDPEINIELRNHVLEKIIK